MYYVINDIDNPSLDDDDEGPFLEIHEELLRAPKRGWHSGAPLEEPPTEIIQVEATPHFGYQGPPPDYYDDAISLMSPRLAQVLQKTGVDNIEYYPVVISYRNTGETYEWLAFNIVGLVSAADPANSRIKSDDAVALKNCSIDGFTLDPTRTRGLALFRLAENLMTTLVSEQVKQAIEQAGINTFAFTRAQDWIRI